MYFCELGKVDDAGNLLEDGLKADLKERALPEHLKEIADSVATTCVAKAKENTSLPPLTAFDMCVLKEFVNACPEDKQDTSSQLCINIRKSA